jgi:hypothetical protein
MSKSVQAERKAKARFLALLRRSRSSRRSLKDAQATRHNSPSPIHRLSFSTSPLNRSNTDCNHCHSLHFLLQLIRFVIELCFFLAANVDIFSDSTKYFLRNRLKKSIKVC